MRTAGALAAAFALAAAGCHTTTLRSGLPPGEPASGYDPRWHGGWLLGFVEASGPHDLARLCPEGWAIVKTETSIVQGLIQIVTVGVYTPQYVTIVCSSVAGPAPRIPESPPPPTSAYPTKPDPARHVPSPVQVEIPRRK